MGGLPHPVAAVRLTPAGARCSVPEWEEDPPDGEHRCVTGGIVGNVSEAECADCIAAKAKAKRKAEKGAKLPPGVPNTEWSKWTPPITGYTWHGKLWNHLNPFTRVLVIMTQMAFLDKTMKGDKW